MKLRQTALLLVCLLLAGCASELPADKQEYVGLWKNLEVSLLITQGGRIEYENRAGSATTSLSAPIKAFTAEKITAGVFFLTTDFIIDRPPSQQNGIWSVVIDGRELFKTDDLGRLPQTQVIPDLAAIRALVTRDLELLGSGIAANDFTAFINDASLQFQSQFSNDQMRQNYKPFIDQKIELASFMKGDFILTAEPEISPEGVLTVNGRYPTSPVSLKFRSTFVYAHPQWKTIGVNVIIDKD